MWRNIARMRRLHGADYEIAPTTYMLPEDAKLFNLDRETNGNKMLWILKPAASSCGRGIKILNKKSPIPRRSGWIASRYISRPHLINGRKYDLRLYVLVSSFDPLRVYLFKEGLVRFATEKYTTNQKSLKKRFIHLTNYSVNKKALSFAVSDGKTDEALTSKWGLGTLRKHFEANGLDYVKTLERVKDVIVKGLISVEPHVVNSLNRWVVVCGTNYLEGVIANGCALSCTGLIYYWTRT